MSESKATRWIALGAVWLIGFSELLDGATAYFSGDSTKTMQHSVSALLILCIILACDLLVPEK